MLAGAATSECQQFAKAIVRPITFNMDLGLALKKLEQENYDNSLQTRLVAGCAHAEGDGWGLVRLILPLAKS